MTPVFLGGEPVKATTGKYAGNHILQEEQDRGLALMQALSEEQQALATLSPAKVHDDNQGEANQDNLVLAFEGVPVADFSVEQKSKLLDLIGLFVGNLREGHAEIRMQEITEKLEETRFSWVGEVSNDAVFYYRIHSPVVLIEFDHKFPKGMRRLNKARKPTRDHIHVVIRTPNGNDYGKDLLRQHLDRHAH
jgi:hypothetical protein